jgi:multidrug resistance efflux pump
MTDIGNGHICTCHGDGGCAHHGNGPAGVYRKSFEHASDNYNAEKARANREADRADRAEARYKSAEADIDHLVKEKSVLEQRIIELRAAYRAAAWEMLESEMKMRQRGIS